MSTMMKPRPATDAQVALVERVRRYIDAHADEPLPLERLARASGVSPAHLQRTFTRIAGLSP
jgi:AraC-like DNA-binding protein